MCRMHTLILAIVLILMVACGPEELESPTPTETTPPLSPPAATTVPSPTQVSSVIPPVTEETEPTAEPTATPTKGLTGPRATAMALANAVTVNPATPVSGEELDDSFLGVFERAWWLVQENYLRDDFNGADWDAVREEYWPRVEAAGSQEAFWEIMADFIGELNDNHSRFVRPDQFAGEFDLTPPGEGEFRPWPGLTLWQAAREDDLPRIWYVCDVGPAADAGLSRGDLILSVDGEPVEAGSDFSEVTAALYGDRDSVTLTVQRGPEREPEEIEIVFGGAAGCDGWQYGFLSSEPRIGYIRIPNFAGNSDVNILEAIELMEEDEPLEGLVLDVRHNPGGNSDRDIANFTTGIFGQVGPLREEATRTIYRIRGPVRWNETTPVAVLIDGNSHSAAEYFATAMQQSGRAIIVGMPTAGNTEGISGFSLPDGSLIRLAVMTLQLPDGSTLEGTGVIPDIQVPLGEWGLRQVPDVQLDAAYNALVVQ